MPNARNQLRIIGGRWRGRKLQFPAVEAIRPTPDRVRETLFNWLQNDINGSRCLDLFAGSGALGLEALSRGAAEVTFVDREPMVTRYLQNALTQLAANDFVVCKLDALKFLAQPPQAFDVVFLDPPFDAHLLAIICARLENNWLRPGALIYLECAAADGIPELPATWQLIKSKIAGQVGYHLARTATSLA